MGPNGVKHTFALQITGLVQFCVLRWASTQIIAGIQARGDIGRRRRP